MALKRLLRILCCPPFPRAIVSHIAFWPPQSSYRLVPRCGSSHLMDLSLVSRTVTTDSNSHSCCCGRSSRCVLQDRLDAFTVGTSRGNFIVCAHLRCSAPLARYTILYSHENAVDLGQILGQLHHLADQLQCNILCYDYSGYGASSGAPSERNLYADAEAAWHALVHRYRIPPHRVIVYGSSIGSAAAVHLASRQRCACLVLQSALASGMRVLFNSSNSNSSSGSSSNNHKNHGNRSGSSSGDGSFSRNNNINNFDNNSSRCKSENGVSVAAESDVGGVGRLAAGEEVRSGNRCGGGGGGAAALRRCVRDPFPNLERIGEVTCPVLVVHGTDDEVVGIEQGLELYEQSVHRLPPLWIEGAGHCDIQLYSVYIDRMRRLVMEELPGLTGNWR